MKREKIGFFGATVQKRSDSEFVFEKERERETTIELARARMSDQQIRAAGIPNNEKTRAFIFTGELFDRP